MTPEDFIDKWRAVRVSEIAASQSHFNDLCELIEEPKPLDVDPAGERYAFEKHLFKLDGRPGRADVWKRGCFAWEYKRVGRYKSLAGAYAQLKEYADALENPPLLIVCDISEIQIHTNFTNTVKTVHVIKLGELYDPKKRQLLKQAFTNPQLLKPDTTREQATKDAAKNVAAIARRLRDTGVDAEHVAHFLNKIVFCMFSEDIGLLPNYLFTEILEQACDRPKDFRAMAGGLFRAMRDRGSFYGTQRIPWFNGGLFADDEVLELSGIAINELHKVSLLDWSAIEPPIFGTLFERGLDPEKRAQLASLLGEQKGGGVGIHYTDPDKIMKIVEPVILRPLRAEWDQVKTGIIAEQVKKAEATNLSARTRYDNNARQIYAEFLDRLGSYRVLDPACGSGNFLYVALLRLKDFEMQVLLEAEDLGLPRQFPRIGPEAVMGIEINPYAAELARLVVWIGEIQWQLKTGYDFRREPILRPLNQIECRDALINSDGTEADWPKVDAIIGNPPFLGDKSMRDGLGSKYTEALRSSYAGRVSGGSDLVCYWFEKTRAKIENTEISCVGLVATNAIRRGANRVVLDRIAKTATIFDVWPDEEWTIEGAAVRVALICFSQKHVLAKFVSGLAVENINSDLSSLSVDLTKVQALPENVGVALQGPTKGGAFDIPGAVARRWLMEINQSRNENKSVLKPWFNGAAITDRWKDTWIVDFDEMKQEEASLYKAPFEHVLTNVKPARLLVDRDRRKRLWWQFNEPAPGLRTAIRSLERFVVAPETPTHNVFAWLPSGVSPDKNLVAIARNDDTTFGILHSRFHLSWIQALGSPYGNHPTARRYNSTRVFRTFPFPEGLTPNIPAANYADDSRAVAIAAAAKTLNAIREAWLNPPELVKRVPEVVPGYPDRILPVDTKAAEILKKRTLTNLYNERPDWLDDLHKALDSAVARAYGWPEDISDDDALGRLFALNQERAAAGR